MKEEQVQKLQRELEEYKEKLSARDKDIEILFMKLNESNNQLSLQETENVSLRRRIDRSDLENDQLLQQLDSLSKSILVYEDTQKTLREEIQILKQQVTESTMARDNVIEKLKDVSIETRELIDNCEKAFDESKLFKNKTEELQEELRNLQQQNKSLLILHKNAQIELQTHKSKITSLQGKLASIHSESPATSNEIWKGDVLVVNNELMDIEKRIKTMITSLNMHESEKRKLKEEIECLKNNHVILQEQNTMKDEIILKQNQDFPQVKATVDEYYSEIMRLDVELKDCNKRVSELNENLEMINSENLNLVDYMHFKRSLLKFGTMENIESLLSKLLVLQEIEHFFEKKFSPHVEPTSEPESNEPIVTDNKQDTINKIKNYLEKALAAIEKLNNKMMWLRTEYEGKLRAKSTEITTLREVLSNAILYNKILEQTLQQYKDNVHLDKTIYNETDKLLIVNETLLDGFDTLKQLYRIYEQSNCFLYAKSDQLKLGFRLLKIYVPKLKETSAPNQATLLQKLDGIIVFMSEIFEEINKNEPSAQKLVECQQIIEECEKSLVTKDYLKNTVETMSLEVKRLTSKVEHEMAEKIREIEQLKDEVGTAKIDNRELVDKIKTCNKEIISLSTENYDLNEKLESFPQITKKCEILKQELANMKKFVSSSDSNRSQPTEDTGGTVTKMKYVNEMCLLLKSENANLKQSVITYFQECENTLAETRSLLTTYSPDQVEQLEGLKLKCCNIDSSHRENVKQSATQFQEDIDSFSKRLENLPHMQNLCTDLRKDNENLKADLVFFMRTMLTDALPRLHSSCDELFKHFDSFTKMQRDEKNEYSDRMKNVAVLSKDINMSSKSIRSALEGMMTEFLKHLQTIIGEILTSVLFTIENIKSSSTISNDEMIKEMQEMNAELKNRGETISKMTQSLSDEEKEKKLLLQQLNEKEVHISELATTISNQEKIVNEKDALLETVKKELQDIETSCSADLKQKTELVENLSAEVDNFTSKLRSKDDIITSLKNEILKQKDMHDGDVSSVGTISKTDEVSRLKDVEDSFEERYIKLRIIAVKMKKNISELTQQLEAEKAERTGLQNKVTGLTEQAKRSQILQEECDKLNDDLELKLNELKELKKIIIESDKINGDLKNQLKEVNAKLELLEKNLFQVQSEKAELEMKMKESAAQLNNVNKEKLAEEILRKEREKEIQQLKQTLQENEEVKKKILNNLEEAKLEVKKQGALSLEMKDFEKTMSDLTNDVEEKKKKIEQLNKKLNISVNNNASLAERIKQLEGHVTSYAASNKSADEQILTLNKKVFDYEQTLSDKETRLKQAVQQLESEKSENENLTLRYVKSTSEIKRLTESFRETEERLNEQVKVLQSKITVAEDSLMKSEYERGQLKSDYDAYKVRAHNLLQKLKSENNINNHEEKLQSEMSTLGQTIKELKIRLDNTLTELDNQKSELKLVECTKVKLQNKVKELSTNIASRAEELEAARAEHKAYKLSTDTLVKCYKAEIEKLKSDVEEHKIELQKACSKVTERVDTANEMAASRREKVNESSSCLENEGVCNLSNGSHDSEVESIDEAKTYGRKRKHSLIPLDKLLESTKEDKEPRRDESELRENIKSLEEQVQYLSKILYESENNAARNEQQVALLKEEIRRLQRVFEREPHLQNTEYLKNVLFKFVTLPLGDEKSQLVTVLETILKLTPTEKEMLTSIAKGCDSNQKQGAGWTSFLGWS